MPHLNPRRRAARVRPYLPPLAPRSDDFPPAPSAESMSAPGLPSRVLDGLRALPDPRPPQPSSPPRESGRTPLVRLIDAQKAPTEEIPVVAREVDGS